MKNILLFILFFSSANLFSQDWQYLGKQDNGDEYYFKPSTSNTAWIKIVSQSIEFTNSAGRKVNIAGHKMMLYKFDCEERKAGLAHLIIYNKEGKTQLNIPVKEWQIEMEYVIPDSVGEQFLDAFCNQDYFIE